MMRYLGKGVKEQHGLAPGCIDLIPLHGAGGSAPQAEAGDGREGALVPDVERVVVHVGVPQALQVRGRPLDLRAALCFSLPSEVEARPFWLFVACTAKGPFTKHVSASLYRSSIQKAHQVR